jgi:hypothetical protein
VTLSTGNTRQIGHIHAPDLIQSEINKKTKCKQQRHKLPHKIALSTSATMTIAVIVTKTSRTTTHASSATSDSKESANKSSNYWSAGNYHLVVLSKKEDGRGASQVPRKEGTCDLELGHKKMKRLDAFAFTSFLEFDV